MAVKMVANSLTSGDSTVFTGDDDPELVADALPFALKLYESLLEQVPEHQGLLLATGSGFIMYANAFVQTPAGMLHDSEWEEQERMIGRAKHLYLRGRDQLLEAIDLRHKGFQESLKSGDITEIVGKMTKDDVPFLYWAAAGWVAAYSTDPFDLSVGAKIPLALEMMNRAYELDPKFSNGVIDEFYISFYGSMPAGMGGDSEKARVHFRKALETSGGKTAGPYVSLATTVCISEQNAEQFVELLKSASGIDPDADPAARLVNILNIRKADWYLQHIDDYFLLDTDEDF